MENSYKLKKATDQPVLNNVHPSGNFATPCNPRLKELKKTETPMGITSNNNGCNSGPASGTNSPCVDNGNNKFSTPVWLRPHDPNNSVKFNFDYELAMERLKTPNNDMNRSKLMAAKNGDTPLDEMFMNAIQIACERNRKGIQIRAV
jgi:hypothetical protein